VATKKCPLCFFRPLPANATSSPADVVLTVAFREIHGLPTTIRSVRTAGVAAAIVVLADSIAANVIRKAIPKIEAECGVLVVDVGRISPEQLARPWRVEAYLIFDFLSLNVYGFKRFIVVDGSETFFQGDPFRLNVRDSQIYFATLLGVNGVQSKTNSTRPPPIAVTPVLGGVAPFLAFCEFLFRFTPWATAPNFTAVNASINQAIEGGSLKKARIRYIVLPPGVLIAVVGSMDRQFGPMYDAKGYITLPRHRTPATVISEYLAHPKSVAAQIKGFCWLDEIQWSFKNAE
jgi:hypothetical protein